MNAENPLRCKLLTFFNNETFAVVMELESFFPKMIKYPLEKLREHFENPANVHMFLERDGLVIGYILATPHNDAVKELAQDDPFMKSHEDCYYIDQIVVAPNERRGLIFLVLVNGLIGTLEEMGVKRISSHILATGRLHMVISRSFRKTLIERRMIRLKMHGNELFEYMEAWCKKIINEPKD